MKRWWEALRAKADMLFAGTNYLRRMIWLGCIAVAVPIVLSGTGYYHFAMSKLSHQFQEESRSSLDQLKERMENALTRIELESLQMSAGSMIRSALSKRDFASQYVQQTEIMDALLVQKNSDNLIEEIVFYERASNVVLSSSYGSASLENSPQKDVLRGVFSMKTQGSWVYTPGIGPDGSMTYVRLLPVMKIGAPQGALLIHVRIDALRKQLFNTGQNALQQSLLVMDADRTVMLHSSDNAAIGQAAERVPMLKWILNQDGASEYDLLTYDKGKLLVMYHKTALDRVYVITMPEEVLSGQLAWIRAFVALSVLLCLCLGVLLTYLASKVVYSPIDKLAKYGEKLRSVGESKTAGAKQNEIEFIYSCLSFLNEQAETLDRYVKSVQPNLRDQFLIKLLKSNGRFDRKAAEPYLQLYHIPQAGTYVAMIVKVDNLFKEKRFLPNEGAVIVFAVNNVMLELLERYPGLQGYIIDLDGKESAAIVHFAETENDPSEQKRLIGLFAEEVCASLKNYMSFTVSVGIGGGREGIGSLHESYREARLALQQRLLEEVDAVLFYDPESVAREKVFSFNYPKSLETLLIEALSRGELAEAEKLLLQFSRTIRTSDSYDTVMQCYHVLLSSVIQALEHEGYGAMDQLDSNLFEQLKLRQTSQEVQDWFIETLFPLYRHITEEFRANEVQHAVRRVCRHIEEHEGTPTLVECAELVRLSPSYLSRMFKKETSVSFIEYVMKFKLEKAKRLLAETDHSVMEIAGMVGYSERNLNRAFQKNFNHSPKQYRNSTRTGGQ
ncbi:helix-turn-helix domain-containing protein [Paenibacillus thalictri]|uniref:Helix-turn-helix domain-containing protein n=1 Tax=Paenibacillus thalictri TaxID=2527873 RepID=A0A4Q9DF09_9BACL|nr:AraC family transcriptional regulator [Paenibacillus thalictri]TBL70431.1 helix-turn-helix domain-containing protein [Paenibacillus thalictri]